MQIMAATINRLQLPTADVVIEPDIAEMGKVTFADKRALIELSERAARERLREIRRAILGGTGARRQGSKFRRRRLS